MAISAKAILPGKFDPDAFSREMIKEMDKFNAEINKDFDKTVATWDHKPKFRATVAVAQDLIEGHVRTVRIYGDKPPELIYYFINQGTKVRFARMTRDFEPKTRVRVIDSFPGAGGLEAVDPRIPNPGIVGRKFNEAIATKHRARLAFRLQVALKRGAIASGHLFK